jgi:hypothetical protein
MCWHAFTWGADIEVLAPDAELVEIDYPIIAPTASRRPPAAFNYPHLAEGAEGAYKLLRGGNRS